MFCFWTSKTHQGIGPKLAERMGEISYSLLSHSCVFSSTPGVIPTCGLPLQAKELWPDLPVSKATGMCPWVKPG